jgi:class 3 adenylate cyclase
MQEAIRNFKRLDYNSPRIVICQLSHCLILEWIRINQKRNIEVKSSAEDVIGPTPSILSYYTALLLIDISGFTLLSQQFSVDELKTHINGYFKKIIDKVEKMNGDIVKFAGDALYVIWPYGK